MAARKALAEGLPSIAPAALAHGQVRAQATALVFAAATA